jgi:hypothetical protein
MTTETYGVGPHYRTPSECPKHSSRMTSPVELHRTRRDAKVYRRTPPTRDHLRIMESICHKFLLYQEKGQKITPCPRLLTHQ